MFIERCGANLMIRLRGDCETREYSMFSAIPSLPGNTVVVTSIGALTSQDLSQPGLSADAWIDPTATSPADTRQLGSGLPSHSDGRSRPCSGSRRLAARR
jgi:hypothetical protein